MWGQSGWGGDDCPAPDSTPPLRAALLVGFFFFGGVCGPALSACDLRRGSRWWAVGPGTGLPFGAVQPQDRDSGGTTCPSKAFRERGREREREREAFVQRGPSAIPVDCSSTYRITTSPVVSHHMYTQTIGSLPPSSRHCPIGGIIATAVCIIKVGLVMCFLCSLLEHQRPIGRCSDTPPRT